MIRAVQRNLTRIGLIFLACLSCWVVVEALIHAFAPATLILLLLLTKIAEQIWLSGYSPVLRGPVDGSRFPAR